MLTLKEAAEQAGRSKPAILKAIHKGTISAAKNELGQWEIDPAELFRVYKRKAVTENLKSGESEQREPPTSAELTALRERLALIETERERERQQLSDQIEDLRRRLDAADERFNQKDRQLTALLTSNQSQPQQRSKRGLMQLLGLRG